MKPKISISFNNGVIGAVTPLDTGCFGIIASAVSVAGGFQLGKAYQLKSMKDVADLKLVDSIDNHRLYKALSEFYTEAGDGSEVWIYGMAKSTSVSSWFTQVNGVTPAENLLNLAKGKLRGLFTVCDSSVVPVIAEAMDEDVLIAAQKAQLLVDNYTKLKYAPFFVMLEGFAFSGDKVSLPDLTESAFNSVGILIGDTEKRTSVTNSNGCAMGLLAGRLAKYPACVNVGKVRNGALTAPKLYINDTPVENYDTEALYDKGYITFTTHQSRAGYFFMDEPLACPVDDDYHFLARRRTINEAFRFTYDALLEFLLDEVPTNSNGSIVASYAKTIESSVERTIATNMSEDLSKDSADSRDSGVKCFVDPEQNIITTSRLEVVVQIRPFGYNRWINVLLGFEI